MVEILDTPAPNVVAVRIEGPGSETEADADAIRDALDAASGSGPSAEGLYVEVGWIWGDTREQFAGTLRERLGRLAARDDVRRVAFVSGSYPRRTILRDEAAPLDGVEVRVFPAAARAAALGWVAGGAPEAG